MFAPADAELELRPSRQIVQRAWVLWNVACYADATHQAEILGDMDKNNLWNEASPVEQEFLRNTTPDNSARLEFKWCLESSWLLLWCLRKVCFLRWPTKLCDVQKMADVFAQLVHAGGAGACFWTRSKGSVLDTLDLTLRLHWAARDRWLAGSGSLDQQEAMVLEQRHKALNWVLDVFGEPWDSVPTHT